MDRCIFSGSPRLRGDTGIRACWHESFEPRCGHPPIEGGFILRLGAGFSFLFLAKKKQSIFRQRTAPLCDGGNCASFCQGLKATKRAYRTNNVSDFGRWRRPAPIFYGKSHPNRLSGVRTLIQFLSRIILGGFLETAPRWLPARLDLAVIGCRIRPCRYNLPVGLGDVRMRPMLVANRLGMARCGCRNDRFCHAAKPAGSGR